ncbi:DUF3889 domain-containing protein [Psychrobacillus sp. FSL W7-1457]|uniref:DUF3889 domain-containing protein n=2 Tax=unclassified Psychrobacillus TaxID=2636677 RepID=UPI00315AB457
MKMIKKVFIAIGICMLATTVSMNMYSSTYAQDQVPAYAKWGKLAVKETQTKYPNATIIDYLHIGSETKEDSTIERFKLWMKDGNKEFGVFINIKYTTVTGKLVNIEFQETSR